MKGVVRGEAKLWRQVNKDGPGGCWLWTGRQIPLGYGQLRVNGKSIYAHRFAYEFLVGPIPDGLTIDHLCRVRQCIRPDHLEAVTLVDNIMRGEGFGAVNAAKTHCPRGHEYTAVNTYVRVDERGRRSRFCRACKRHHGREATARRRGR